MILEQKLLICFEFINTYLNYYVCECTTDELQT